MVKKREEVAEGDRWNLDPLFSSLESWNQAFEKIAPKDSKMHWPELHNFRGKLGQGAEKLKAALDECHRIEREVARLYTYAHLRNDEELTHDQHKGAYGKALNLYHDYQAAVAWLQPEILSLPESTLTAYLQNPILAPYKFLIERISKMKKHTLAPEQEHLMALASKALQAPRKAFSALNDADFKFGTVEDGQGKQRELTHGSYGIFIRDQDRVLRQNSFKKLHNHYKAYENTICELLSGRVQDHLFNARARNYTTCLDAALYHNNIDLQVYHALIKAIRDNISSHHRYIRLRKKLLNLSEIHLYDMYVPVTPNVDIRMTYDQAVDAVVASVSPLGKEYQAILAKGLGEQRWVDRYENTNKRSGAYSSGCFDSPPYILMNYKDIIRDVFTLSHEAGHSMHSFYSRKYQPYHYADYPIFVAEVASTFNEELLNQYLLKQETDVEKKIFLINQKIEDIRGTLFRQTMFAEFELWIHEMAEKGTPLTPKLIKEKYRELNQFYFGPDVVIDPEIDIEWARIPHFYSNFYVYQYATGISAALALAHKVTHGGKQDVEQYLGFLSSGSSQYPIDLLKKAGVDMRSPEPVICAIREFSRLTQELEQLTEKRSLHKSHREQIPVS